MTKMRGLLVRGSPQMTAKARGEAKRAAVTAEKAKTRSNQVIAKARKAGNRIMTRGIPT